MSFYAAGGHWNPRKALHLAGSIPGPLGWLSRIVDTEVQVLDFLHGRREREELPPVSYVMPDETTAEVLRQDVRRYRRRRRRHQRRLPR